jgi:hypothetical protein
MTSPSLLCGAFVLLLTTTAASAGERYALVVSGASGGQDYAQKHDRWRTSIATTLRDKLRFPEENVIVLAETPAGAAGAATSDGVRAAIDAFRRRLTRDDLFLIVLIGHGTFDGIDAKFNLVGPDLEASDWTELLTGLPAYVAVVNTTGGSFPFLQRMSAPRRIIITATDSSAQVYETVFAEFFAKALEDPAADLDKNGRISLAESFTWASSQVRSWYLQKGQLSTERPLLDDNADGVGREAGAPGPDGGIAGVMYLDEEADVEGSGDPTVAELRRRRTGLEADIEALKLRKPLMTPEAYESELERLLIELATVSRDIRSKSD